MSSRKISDLAADIQPLALDLVHECKLAGIEVLIYCTYRSPEEQAELWASGRTKPGPIKTHAQPGQSKHNLSINGKPAARAFDAAPVVCGKIAWDTSGEDGLKWVKMGSIAMALGLRWGGAWKGAKQDYPHFEMKD
jgi:peptidoglycan L-alanyl-D-glutamate endopeptidase CwlK